MVKIEDLIDNSDLTVLNKNLLSNFVFRKKLAQEKIKNKWIKKTGQAVYYTQ